MKKMKKLVALLCAVSMIIPGNAVFASNISDIPQTGTSEFTEGESGIGESEAAHETETESGSGSVKGPEFDSADGTVSESENGTGSEPESESKSETKNESESVSESGIESEAESESESESEPETETETDVVEQENSWRFEDGVWVGSYGISTFADISPDAWTNVNGNYVNSNGDVIQGAIARGIDVSEWQGKIEWNKVINDDISFAIIRSGAGQTYNDKYWEYNTAECERLGIPYGTYLYSYAQSPEDAVKEADHLLELVAGRDLNYPIYYDLEDVSVLNETLEDGTKRQRTSAEIAAIAKAFCDRVSSAGYEVQIYANTYWWNNYLTDSYFSQFTNRWVAQYAANCTYGSSYAMWQCTSSGKVDGIAGNVDIDMLYTDQYDKTFAVKRFVTRLYELVLDRKPDPQGLINWTNALINKERDGAALVVGFLYSDEYLKRNTSNEEFVETLYNTCLDRKSDTTGKTTWVNRLNQCFSRYYVLKGFIESTEFTLICSRYGIDRGGINLTEYRDQNVGVTEYVGRLYYYFLQRNPDPSGLNDWTKEILENSERARTLPYDFILSTEFYLRNISDEEFVGMCYKAILDREVEKDGLENWVNLLEKGWTRSEVCAGITNSVEFTKLLAKYGL